MFSPCPRLLTPRHHRAHLRDEPKDDAADRHGKLPDGARASRRAPPPGSAGKAHGWAPRRDAVPQRPVWSRRRSAFPVHGEAFPFLERRDLGRPLLPRRSVAVAASDVYRCRWSVRIATTDSLTRPPVGYRVRRTTAGARSSCAVLAKRLIWGGNPVRPRLVVFSAWPAGGTAGSFA